MTTFTKESDFEENLITVLTENGWENKILKYCTEDELKKNWADILFENNREIDKLNSCPLTDSEMDQIISQINNLKTPIKINEFINGKTVSIKRDNPDDKLHFGHTVSLKIYDRREIAAGESRYQIAQQPKFTRKSKILNDRRGDLMLLINGMPVIHIELKRSGVPVSQACNQIQKYYNENIFTGLFSLVQIFVAMNPDETVYFANPGAANKFNPDFYFHWADFNNEPINKWNEIASSLLSIPMAHQLIGFYTVADNTDGVLKVMRSYQYFAASFISDKVAKSKWTYGEQRGGYIWHTTGSGKTMTSFKSAQLIANSNDADKVIFLMDRVELGTQSLIEYRNFANVGESVQATENTDILISKLKSSDSKDTLIVTSIQKMSNIKEGPKNLKDIELINKKRMVFIIDEAHRSTFGEMLFTIKNTFPRAMFFGFTGTPIQEENKKKKTKTSDIFGNELHKYSIADGIRDKNVLGFDLYKVSTFDDYDLRKAVALDKANVSSENDIDQDREEIYNKYMDKSQVPMAGYKEGAHYIKGIEDLIPSSQYETSEHTSAVVESIIKNYTRYSNNNKFHAIFATNSIPEAINYYRLIKEAAPDINITALFDPNIDNTGNCMTKEDGLAEIINDYNEKYNQDFTMGTFAKMKKDMSARLAHKKPYERLSREQQVDILIVVDQMLTGFDSKWVNTLYLDKVLQFENIIQAFSRTNRIYGEGKPFGIIYYYRKPHTMERNITQAVDLYSGDKPLAIFVPKLLENLKELNKHFGDIKNIFNNAKIENYKELPKEETDRKRFVDRFNKFNKYFERAKIQGFTWDRSTYSENGETVTVEINKHIYHTLIQRYKELSTGGNGGAGPEPGPGPKDGSYDIKNHLIEVDTGQIDNDYMNSNFKKYLKILNSGNATQEEINKVEAELHKSFSSLSQIQQKYAIIFLHDIQRGEVEIQNDKTFIDYINEYVSAAQNDQIHIFADTFGLNEHKLRALIDQHPNKDNLNVYHRYDDLKNIFDIEKAKEYFGKKLDKQLSDPRVRQKMDKLLRESILNENFEI